MYTDMRTRMRKATLFRAKPTTDPTKYLVYYHNKAGMMMKKDLPGQSMNSRL